MVDYVEVSYGGNKKTILSNGNSFSESVSFNATNQNCIFVEYKGGENHYASSKCVDFFMINFPLYYLKYFFVIFLFVIGIIQTLRYILRKSN